MTEPAVPVAEQARKAGLGAAYPSMSPGIVVTELTGRFHRGRDKHAEAGRLRESSRSLTNCWAGWPAATARSWQAPDEFGCGRPDPSGLVVEPVAGCRLGPSVRGCRGAIRRVRGRAIGAVVGGRLFQHGYEVVLIARGTHYDAMRVHGLRLQDPTREVTLPVPVVDHPGKVRWRVGDVVLVAVKSQHTPQVLVTLASVAPSYVAVVCLQNGVRNEPEALRRFANVYGVPVAGPAVHLEPGIVQAYSTPVTGILDVGRFPEGADDTASAVAAAFTDATFNARAISDVARWKWRKLVTNLGNAVEAVCGPPARQGPIGKQAAAEGEACVAAAGIEAATTDEDRARRAALLQVQPIAGQRLPGGSSWQSLVRGAHSIETDYLNGEVVLLGRLHRVATPVNALLQQLANRLAATGGRPGSVRPEEFEAMLVP